MDLLTLDELQSLSNLLLAIPGMADPSTRGNQMRGQLLLGQPPDVSATFSLGVGPKQDIITIVSTLRERGVSDPPQDTPLWILLDQAIYMAGDSWGRLRDLKALQDTVRQRLGLPEVQPEILLGASRPRSNSGTNIWTPDNTKRGVAALVALFIVVLIIVFSVPRLRGMISGPSPSATTTLVSGAASPSANARVEPSFTTQAAVQATSTLPSQVAEATPTPPIGIVEAAPTAPTGPTPGIIRIGVDLPLNGEDGALGEPVLNGAILAVEEANARGEIVLNGLNYRLELVTHDDAVDGKQNQLQGARNALDFSQDPQMLAVVGPYDSSLVPVVVPRLNAAGLAQISPADTNTGSTTDPNLRRSGKVTYFRVCATDDLQAQAISQYVFGALHLQKIYVLDDTTVYGKGLADSVERYFKEMGATVVAHEGMPPEMTDFKKLIDDIMLTNAEAVVYGGAVNDNMELMSEQIKTNTVVKRSGRDFPPFVLVGGPGNLESRFISLVGPEAEGSYATLIGMDARYFPPATHFVEAYNARFGAAIGVYSVNGYQAVRIIVDAIRRAGTFDREAVRQALAGIQLTGEPMDMIVFDENGDSRSSWISIYQVRNGLWTFVDQLPANR